MVSNSAKLNRRTMQHTEFGVSASNGSRDMGRTKVAEKKEQKNERRQSHKASPTGIANYNVIARNYLNERHAGVVIAIRENII